MDKQKLAHNLRTQFGYRKILETVVPKDRYKMLCLQLRQQLITLKEQHEVAQEILLQESSVTEFFNWLINYVMSMCSLVINSVKEWLATPSKIEEIKQTVKKIEEKIAKLEVDRIVSVNATISKDEAEAVIAQIVQKISPMLVIPEELINLKLQEDHMPEDTFRAKDFICKWVILLVLYHLCLPVATAITWIYPWHYLPPLLVMIGDLADHLGNKKYVLV